MAPERRRGILRRGTDVRRVVRTGKRGSGNLMVVYVAPGGSLARVAFVCGRRVGGAVVRNRGRRLLREAWRSVRARARGFDVVFVARPEIQGAKTPDVIVDMDRALLAAGVTP
jgi:ribonuclease P protein component